VEKLTNHRNGRGVWRVQAAKARFRELVRRAQSEGPQCVLVDEGAAVIVVDADEFRRMQGIRTGQLLVDALKASPHRASANESRRTDMRVRTVKL
jgi:prevent-host-death family protein